MTQRGLRRLAWIGLLGCLLSSGCTVYEPGLITLVEAGRGGRSGAGAGSGGKPPEPCVPSAEVCNNRDDDCNGVVDDEQPANADCSVRYHAKVECGRGGFCLFMPMDPMCDPGWYHCDGLPETGCESDKPCFPKDASTEDAGADDAG